MSERPVLETISQPVTPRRGFLAGVAGVGLATAAAMFGRATPAYATVSAGCCNLCFSSSGSHTMAACETGRYYVWSCAYGGSNYLFCYCCEHGTTGDNCNGVTYSKYDCHYG